MAFHVGQRIICVNVTPRRDGLVPRYTNTAIPKLGGVYTIREIFDARPYGHDDLGLLLEEVVNTIRRYICQGGPVTIEQFWLSYRFRPLRTTNIDVLKAMLEPVPVAAEGTGRDVTAARPRAREHPLPQMARRNA